MFHVFQKANNKSLVNLLQSFTENIHSKNLFTQKDQLIIATSGGIDSMVLCDLCQQAGFQFSIAHCNFQLRGEESERDEAFVRDFAAGLKAEFFLKKFDTETYANQQKISIQEAAR